MISTPVERLVLVAGELHELSGPDPEWPGGRQTLFHPPGTPLPRRADVDALIPLVSQGMGEKELEGLPSQLERPMADLDRYRYLLEQPGFKERAEELGGPPDLGAPAELFISTGISLPSRV